MSAYRCTHRGGACIGEVSAHRRAQGRCLLTGVHIEVSAYRQGKVLDCTLLPKNNFLL